MEPIGLNRIYQKSYKVITSCSYNAVIERRYKFFD